MKCSYCKKNIKELYCNISEYNEKTFERKEKHFCSEKCFSEYNLTKEIRINILNILNSKSIPLILGNVVNKLNNESLNNFLIENKDSIIKEFQKEKAKKPIEKAKILVNILENNILEFSDDKSEIVEEYYIDYKGKQVQNKKTIYDIEI